jgi:hypothetical protein
MKSRHAAALALVGWYLTVYGVNVERCLGCSPPPGPAISDVWGVYHDASHCHRVQKKLMTRLVENQRHPKSEYLVHWGIRCDPSDEQTFKAKGLQLKFLSPSEKSAIIATGARG